MAEKFLVANVMTIAVLFFVVIVVAMLLKRIKFPYTIGLVIAGICLALLGDWIFTELPFNLDDVRLSPEVILYVLLPSLIFEAAINIDSRLLMKNLAQVLILSVPGLLISMLIIALGLRGFTTIPLEAGLLFGALISATDPVAVIHTFRDIGAPKRLTLLVDGESLFNDATAIVVFHLILFSFLPGAHEGVWPVLRSLWDFFYVFFGGLLMGFLIAFVMFKLIKKAKTDALVQITAMTVVAYVTFAVTNYYLEVSGVMAVVAAGIVLNWYRETYLSPTVKHYIKQYWEYIAFIANSIVFLLLGVTGANFWVSKQHSPHLFTIALWAVALVTVARAFIVYGLLPFVSFTFKKSKTSNQYKHIIFWGGLRGAVPLALAFSLSRAIESQQLVIELTLIVVLFTLFVQGTTLRKAIHFFKLDRKTALEEINEVETLLCIKQKGFQRILHMEKEQCFSEKFLEEMKNDYAANIAELEQSLAEFREDPHFADEGIKKLLWHYTIAAEREIYSKLFEQGFISKPVLHELSLNIELTQDRVRRGEHLEIFVMYVPLETKIKGTVGKVLLRFFTRSRFLLRLIQHAYLTKYEISLAMVIACNHIEPIIEDLSQMYSIDASIVEDCLTFYRKRKELAMKYIGAIDEEDVPSSFRREKIRLVALNAEYDELRQLEPARKIFEKVYQELEKDLENKLEESKEQAETYAFEYVK